MRSWSYATANIMPSALLDRKRLQATFERILILVLGVTEIWPL